MTVALLAALVTTSGLLGLASAARAGETHKPARTAAAGWKIAFGAVDDLDSFPARARAMRAAGLSEVRIGFPWERNESRPPSSGGTHAYDWSATDAVVRASATNRIALLPLLDGTPEWAMAPYGQRGSADTYPAEIDDYTSWASALVARYGPGGSFWTGNPRLKPLPIGQWQIWNEPNAAQVWTGGEVSPKRYFDLLTKSARRIREIDSKARIVVAGLAQFRPGIGESADWFWISLFRLLGSDTTRYEWDLHVYSDTGLNAARVVSYVRNLFNRNGCLGCKLRVGEFGWTSGNASATTPGGFLCAGVDGQRQRLTEFLRYATSGAQGNRLISLDWYRWADPTATSSRCTLLTGLVYANGRPKKALTIFSAYARSRRFR